MPSVLGSQSPSADSQILEEKTSKPKYDPATHQKKIDKPCIGNRRATVGVFIKKFAIRERKLDLEII
jgi:hypothetical protein